MPLNSLPPRSRSIPGQNTFPVRSATVIALGSALLWASAKVQVPFWPVPMTMQTYVVLTLGALFGWRLGGATVAAYLAEGIIGLPVFAGTPASGIGVAYMAGPTGGYLVGYLVAAVLVGVLLEHRSTPGIWRTAMAIGAGELTILAVGCAWLAVQLGAKDALALGFGPFLIGDAVKVVLALVTTLFARPLIAFDEATSR